MEILELLSYYDTYNYEIYIVLFLVQQTFTIESGFN